MSVNVMQIGPALGHAFAANVEVAGAAGQSAVTPLDEGEAALYHFNK